MSTSSQLIVIETQGLGKRYEKGVYALKGLDLSVQRGEIFGYLGPNGAGKSTTIRILLDLIRASEGSARVLGLDSRADSLAIRARVGYLPGELSLWGGQKADAVVRYFSRLRGGVDPAHITALTQRLQLDLSKRIRDYSTGNKRKLGLLLALMHEPELLILDEPTSGLDPLMQQTFNTMMREYRDAGRTVFLSSHVLSEVQAICDRVAVLRAGELKTVARVDDLTHVDFQWVTLSFGEGTDLARTAQSLEAVPGVADVTAHNGHALRLRLRGDFDPLLRALGSVYVVDVHTEAPSLEDIFLGFYGQQNLAAEAADVKERV